MMTRHCQGDRQRCIENTILVEDRGAFINTTRPGGGQGHCGCGVYINTTLSGESLRLTYDNHFHPSKETSKLLLEEFLFLICYYHYPMILDCSWCVMKMMTMVD